MIKLSFFQLLKEIVKNSLLDKVNVLIIKICDEGLLSMTCLL